MNDNNLWCLSRFVLSPSLLSTNTIPNSYYSGRIENNFYMQLTTNSKSTFCLMHTIGFVHVFHLLFPFVRYCHVCFWRECASTYPEKELLNFMCDNAWRVDDFSVVFVVVVAAATAFSFHSLSCSRGCQLSGFYHCWQFQTCVSCNLDSASQLTTHSRVHAKYWAPALRKI